MIPDKSALVQDLIKGNREAYTLLFKFYYKNLCAYSYKIVKDLTIAEEVIQDVFLKIWEKRETLHLDHNIEKYLYGAVYNESISVYRRLCNENNFRNRLKQDTALHDRSFDDSLYFQELTNKLEKAIDKLPDKSKEIFLLSRYSSLSYKEISQKMGITPKGVEFHIIKALKILRYELKDYKYDSKLDRT